MFSMVLQQAYCQKSDIRKTEFLATHNLQKIENKDSINRIEQKITSIIQKDNWNKNKLFFSSLMKWKLVYSVHTRYDEKFPNQYKDTNSFYQYQQFGNIQSAENTSYLIPNNKISAFPKFKLLKIFGVKKRINYYPEIYARDARFNGQWTAISLNKDHFIIRYVSSYPDGNLTSWYQEEIYYFKPVETNDLKALENKNN
jgi:hypothetical protein